jgi:hypothetical protein
LCHEAGSFTILLLMVDGEVKVLLNCDKRDCIGRESSTPGRQGTEGSSAYRGIPRRVPVDREILVRLLKRLSV